MQQWLLLGWMPGRNLAHHGVCDAIDEVGREIHRVQLGNKALLVRTHPVKLPDAPISVFCHAKVHREPVNQWLRGMVFELFGAMPPLALGCLGLRACPQRMPG